MIEYFTSIFPQIQTLLFVLSVLSILPTIFTAFEYNVLRSREIECPDNHKHKEHRELYGKMFIRYITFTIVCGLLAALIPPKPCNSKKEKVVIENYK